MRLSYLIIALILLGVCMASTIPVFMCLFFTANSINDQNRPVTTSRRSRNTWGTSSPDNPIIQAEGTT